MYDRTFIHGLPFYPEQCAYGTIPHDTENLPVPMNATLDVSVVVPCHNEQENLRPLANGIRTSLDSLKLAYEVIVTDDCSSDQSWQVLRQLGAEDSRFRALRFANHCGQSAAIWAGIQAARGRIIVTMDADLQSDPSDLPKFLETLRQFDCVCGTRVHSRAEGDSFMRAASSRIANWVRNQLSNETISDAGCCYRAFRRECVAQIRFFKGIHRFLPTLMRMDSFTVTEIPISHRRRLAGKTHYSIWNRLFSSFADLLAVRWMKKRMIRYKVTETIN